MASPQPVPEFERRGDSTDLVVLLHAFRKSRENLRHVREMVAEAKPNADIFAPNLPIGIRSFASPTRIISKLLEQMDRKWEQSKELQSPYRKITFVGHSMGALISRKLYVCACGENPEAPFNEGIQAKEPRPWAEHVERIVLLAGMNRGWVVNHHLSLWKAIAWTIGTLLIGIIGLFRKNDPVIFNIRRGAIFLTELRIQWLRMRQHVEEKGVGKALAIQLLGSIDDMVSPADNLDLISGSDFIYLDVPHSGHLSVVDMDDSDHGRERASVFRTALTAEAETLEKIQVLPADTPAGQPREEVTDVVFVIHGIRDQGYWTNKIARRIRKKGETQGKIIATETSSYGYFPMLSFLFFGERRRKVHWFMDQYAQAVAQYPKAKFSFVGHSNGTYLLARGLRDYLCCRFERVVFAGSVVRRNYQWDRFIKSGKVKEVANYVATADWVVAFFPKAFQMLGIQDLGSAGHDGFVSRKVSQVTYIKGSHGAAIQEENWDAIADFILDGGEAGVHEPMKRESRSPFVLIPGLIAPIIWLLIATILILILYGIWLTHAVWGWQQWQSMALLGIYLFGVYTIVSKL